jgi:purine-binding chemotaxis protein CheW
MTMQTVWSTNSGANAMSSARREFLTFRLGVEDYAIDILQVQEIRVLEAVTKLPATPAYMIGVINLRGLIAPVIDLRIKFGRDEVEYGPFTVLIVLRVADRLVAVVVDAVADVVTLSQEQIKPAPDFSAAINVEYVVGLAAQGDHMLILLDIERLIASQELGLFDSLAPA